MLIRMVRFWRSTSWSDFADIGVADPMLLAADAFSGDTGELLKLALDPDPLPFRSRRATTMISASFICRSISCGAR